MKNKEIITSLNQITVSAERKEAMLHNIFQQADTERDIVRKEQGMKPYFDQKMESKTERNVCKKTKRRLFALIACLLLTIVLIACIPVARAEVIGWFKQIFSVQSYIGEERSNRETEQSLDDLIEKIDNSNRITTIADIYDSDQARALAENFDITLDEIAYTGDAIYITGWLNGTAGKFLLDQYTGGNTWTSDGQWTEGSMRLMLQGGEAYYGDLHATLAADMYEIVEQAFQGDSDKPLDVEYADGQFVSSNSKADVLWAEWLKDRSVRFVCQFSAGQGVPLSLSNQSIANLSFYQTVKSAKDDAENVLFSADLGSVSINTDRYNAVLTEACSAQESVALKGMQRMFIIEHNFVGFSHPHLNYYVQDLDMNGVSITVEKASFAPTGPQLALRLDLPESWTREERIAAICGNEYSGLSFQVLLDGKILPSYMYQCTVTKQILGNDHDPFLTASLIFSDFAIAPSEWDSIKTIMLIPYTACPLELTLKKIVNGQQVYRKMVLQPGTIITQDAMDDSQDTVMWDDCQQDIMYDYTISISIDD